MATTRLLRTSRPIQLLSSNSSFSSSSSSLTNCMRYQSKAKLNNTDADIKVPVPGKGERKPMVASKAAMAASEHIISTRPIVRRGMSDLATLIANVGHVIHVLLRTAIKRKPWNLQPQELIERAIIDCRFFTLFAVLGSLVGSVLCFVEGCLLVIESYVQYFHILSHSLDQGHVMQLLIEAIDMFLVGTAMLVFGVSLYVMFVGSRTAYMKSPPRWVGMHSIAEAKSKMGHAMMMILQVGLLEKFKEIPLVTGFDLACFAGAVLTSSACIFLLARLHQ